MISVLLLVLGAVLLVVGAELFAEHVAPVANRLGITVIGVGILLAGAEPEEAITAVIASLRDAPQLAVGDAVGANFVILSLTVGLAALLTPLPVSSKILKYAVAASVTAIGPILVLADGTISRLDGLLLLAVFVVVIVWIWRTDRKVPTLGELAELDEDELEATGDWLDLVKALLGVGLMALGGYAAVQGAEGMLDLLNLGESAVGLTILALATSSEMLALVWSAHRRGITEVVVAGAIGCVVYNSTVSIGLAALARPMVLGTDREVLSVAVAVVVLPFLLFLGRRRGRLDRWVGALLTLVYVVGAGTLLITG